MCKNREETVSPEKCNGLNRPATTMQCHMMPCPLAISKNDDFPQSSAIWIPSEWTEVDALKKNKQNSLINISFPIFNSVIVTLVHKHVLHDALIR